MSIEETVFYNKKMRQINTRLSERALAEKRKFRADFYKRYADFIPFIHTV